MSQGMSSAYIQAKQRAQSQQQIPTNYKVQFIDETKKFLELDKQRVMPLVRFLKKNGLKFKHAVCRGARIQYFRTDMLTQILQNKKQVIQKDAKLKSIAQTLTNDLVFYKRPQNSQKLKYPQNLIRSQNGKFASFKFDTTQSKKIYFYIVLFLILAGVLFPLWPYELKYGVWLVSMGLLVTLVSICLIRLILYVVLASFGISFWLFPNLFGDYGVLDSLRPIFSVQRWQTNMFSVVLRVVCFGLFLYYCHSIYSEPDFYIENFESAKQVVMDVHDWGVNKIKGDIGNFSQRALTMDKILNQTADAFTEEQQSKNSQYTSFEQPAETDTDENADEVVINQNEGKQNYQQAQQEDL